MLKSIILSILILYSFKTNSIEITQITIENNTKKLNEYYYNLFLDEIKLNEGFRDTIYKCPAGYNTIGYGHQIKSNEVYTNLDKNQAEILLKKDFKDCLKYVEHLSISKKYAAAHFIFCVGIGNYKKIENDFKNKVLKYSYFFYKGKMIYSEYAFKRRLFEFKNYN